MKSKQKQIEAVLGLIENWIKSESGPTHCDFSQSNLSLSVKIRVCSRQTICDEEFSPDSVPPKKFTKRRGYRYLDANTNDEVAVIFHYTLVDGTQRRTINRLIINGVPHDASLP
jgi:hypothetical protein